MGRPDYCLEVPQEGTWTVYRLLRSRLGLSRGCWRRLRRHGLVTVDGHPVQGRCPLEPGQTVEVYLPQAASAVKPEPVPLRIIYEDPFLLAVDKPAGMVIHPSPGYGGATLANGVAFHLARLGVDATPRPVRRLDRDTSGLTLWAKDPHTQHRLSQAMARAAVTRVYLGVVAGRPPAAGEIDLPIGKLDGRPGRSVATGGKPARTCFNVLEAVGPGALLELRPATGRTHQLRVHLAHLGHPLYGDSLYGGPAWPEAAPGSRQALHAHAMILDHPHTGEGLRLEAELPADLHGLLQSLRAEAAAGDRQ